MTIQFVNRKKELQRLEETDRITIIFGRRRVGKTALVKHFARNKPAVYLLAVNKPLIFNLQRFSRQFSEYYRIPGLNFQNFKEMFLFMESREEDIFVIDEFGYLIHGVSSGKWRLLCKCEGYYELEKQLILEPEPESQRFDLELIPVQKLKITVASA